MDNRVELIQGKELPSEIEIDNFKGFDGIIKQYEEPSKTFPKGKFFGSLGLFVAVLVSIYFLRYHGESL